MYISRFLENILASLYAGAFVQLTIDLIGESALCTFIKPLIVGEGFKFIYFHFIFMCIICWHTLILFLSSFCNFLVRSPFTLVKFLLSMNSVIYRGMYFDRLER